MNGLCIARDGGWWRMKVSKRLRTLWRAGRWIGLATLTPAAVCGAQKANLPPAYADAPRPQLLLAQAVPGSSGAAVAGAPLPLDGKLGLTLRQAYTLALANNLDIEIEQADQTIADKSLLLTEGGSLPRLVNFGVAEAPAGVAPLSNPLLSFSATGLSPSSVEPLGATISSSYNNSRVVEGARSLSLGTGPYSAGSSVPGFSTELFGRYGWLRRNPQVSLLTLTQTGVTQGNTAVTDNTLGSTTLTKGFAPGTTIELGVNDFVQSFYSGRSSAVPFSHPNAYALIAQPLLRNGGAANNRRYIAIAKTNKKISSAVLEEQVVSTITGVSALYTDLRTLQEEVKVQQQAVEAAELLLHNDQDQLQVGRLPAIAVAQAESLVESTRMALAQTDALRVQQGVILRTLIDPRSLTGTEDVAEVVAVDPIPQPQAESESTVGAMVKEALDQRSDLRQARLQIANGKLQVGGAANAVKPELDIYATYESRGVIVPGLLATGGDTLTGNTVPYTIPTGGNRSSTIYEAGVQFYLPLRNEVARANLGADKATLRQQQLRVAQLEAQIGAEVRNAVTALHASETAADAAAKARNLQEKLLGGAQESFKAGYGTNLSVIEAETYVAQARTTEVIAKAALLKAVGQLDRVTGRVLDRSGITVKEGEPKLAEQP